MKRKITSFESILVDNGWVLTHKNYTGRFAKRVQSYVYKKYVDNFLFELVITPKRDNIIDLKVHHDLYSIGFKELENLKCTYDNIYILVHDFVKVANGEI